MLLQTTLPIAAIAFRPILTPGPKAQRDATQLPSSSVMGVADIGKERSFQL
jgi:hypothetical protein